MIPSKTRESRRIKTSKLSKNLERLYKERKCRDCSVVVTRMDFAKILGKFTKVKIQYECSKAPKTKPNSNQVSPNTNARLQSNENGMVQLHRNAYNQHPVKDSKKGKSVETTPRASNVLKENNRLKKPASKNNKSNYNRKITNKSNLKHYSIIFEDPLSKNNNNNIEVSCKISLVDLLPYINDEILPSDEWCIDYFPKSEEPKDDKVYDRIAAELEDLMYSDKSIVKTDGKSENKIDDFPSIMDILNDNTSKPNPQISSPEFKSNLESSDVEAMLLGNSNPTSSTPMEVDNTEISNLIEEQVEKLSSTPVEATNSNENDSKLTTQIVPEQIENPQSPSILDETLQKGIEEHLPRSIDTTSENKTDDTSETEKNNETPPIDPQSESDAKVLESDAKLLESDAKVLESEVKVLESDAKVLEFDTEVSKTNAEGAEMIAEVTKINAVVSDINAEATDTATEATETTAEASEANPETTETNAEVSEMETNNEIAETKSDEVQSKEKLNLMSKEGITHVIFKKLKDGSCYKSVTCPKNLKYGIEFVGKSVEFLGAPKYISSLEDLQVLLQIVHESQEDSLYVLH